MSYDLYLGRKLRYNYTYNLCSFFYDFIKEGNPLWQGLESLHGLTGREAARVLRFAIEKISESSRNRPREVTTWEYLSKKYDPTNKWGDVMSATLFLMALYFASIENPRKRWKVQ